VRQPALQRPGHEAGRDGAGRASAAATSPSGPRGPSRSRRRWSTGSFLRRPTSTASDVRELAGVTDGWPVTCEPFSQWVIEDVFPYGRPPWELGGAELVADVEPYEQAKLRILNGAHSAFAYLGLLAGHDEIADAARDESLRPLVLAMLHEEVIPTLSPPAGLDLRDYAASVVDRFGNRALGYTTAKVAGDGSQKLRVRILATVRDRLASGAPVDRLALVFAAYAVCVLGTTCAASRSRRPAARRAPRRRSPTGRRDRTKRWRGCSG
jgi:mannitol-1-phosphate/altronate dehydrogenase